MFTIYCFGFQFDKKVYVGCTTSNISKRLREHRSLLKAGRHTCKPLQEAWNNGESRDFRLSFVTQLHENDSVEAKRKAELFYMELYESQGLLYNQKQSFRPPDGAQAKAAASRVANGFTPSAESNLKRSIAQLGIPKGHGAKISATKQARKNK